MQARSIILRARRYVLRNIFDISETFSLPYCLSLLKSIGNFYVRFCSHEKIERVSTDIEIGRSHWRIARAERVTHRELQKRYRLEVANWRLSEKLTEGLQIYAEEIDGYIYQYVRARARYRILSTFVFHVWMKFANFLRFVRSSGLNKTAAVATTIAAQMPHNVYLHFCSSIFFILHRRIIRFETNLKSGQNDLRVWKAVREIKETWLIKIQEMEKKKNFFDNN